MQTDEAVTSSMWTNLALSESPLTQILVLLLKSWFLFDSYPILAFRVQNPLLLNVLF